MTPAEWLIYSNQGATRNQPIDPALAQAFGFLPELGIQMEVFSGGQPAKGTSNARVGSTRHDDGRSADVFFRKDGKRLDWANPNDVPIFQDVVKRARAAGVTGFGAGPGYMQPGSMHVGFGDPAVWGAGGKGANAPEWLRQAFAGATPGQAVAGDTMRALGREPMKQQMAQISTKSGPMGLLGAMPEEEPGGLLGLLGKKPGWASKANDIGAVLLALSGSPAAAPLLQQVQDRKKDKRETARINQTVQWLQSQGRGDLAEAVAAGTLGGSDAAKIALTPAETERGIAVGGNIVNPVTGEIVYQGPADPQITKGVVVGNRIIDPVSGQVIYEPEEGAPPIGEYGLQPVYGRDAQGNTVIMQLGKDGTAAVTKLPEGVVPDLSVKSEEAARGAEVGKAQGAAITGEGGAVAKAQDAIELIDQILNDPALPSITGMIQGRLPPMSQEGTNLDIKIKQLKGKAFLEAFESLKGGGAITETEGRAATEAMARLDRAQDDAAYSQALNELQAIMRRGKNRAQAAAEKARGQEPTGTVRRKFNPQTGALE